MLSIGDFARHGRVSVRMLRHYDLIGLLVPARVDFVSGYRFYEVGQLTRLHRIIALKELGFTLDQVGRMLDDAVSGAEMRAMLALRRADLEQRIAADRERLVRVEARLRVIEKEGTMPTDEIVVKTVPAVLPHSGTQPRGHLGLGCGHQQMGDRTPGTCRPEVTRRCRSRRCRFRQTGPGSGRGPEVRSPRIRCRPGLIESWRDRYRRDSGDGRCAPEVTEILGRPVG